jgi:hypothetical protein
VSDELLQEPEKEVEADEVDAEQEYDELQAAVRALEAPFRRLVELRRNSDELKTASKKAEEEYKAFEGELWDRLHDSAMQPPFKFDFGGDLGEISFSPAETIFARLLDKDKAMRYFKSQSQDDEFVETKFVGGRLNDEVRERIDDGRPLPPGVDFTPRRYISISGLPATNE